MGLIFSWLRGQKEVAPQLRDAAGERQVSPQAEAPVAAPAEVQVDTSITTTEAEQTHDVCEPQTEVEAAALAEEDTVTQVEAEAAVTEDTSAPITESTEELVLEALAGEPVSADEPAETGSLEVEVVTETAVAPAEKPSEIPEPQQVTDTNVSPAAAMEEDEDEAGVELLAEKSAPEVPAEPITITEDVPAQTVEIPVQVPDAVPEAPAEEAETLVGEVTEVKPEAAAAQDVADTLIDDFVVTESVSAVEIATAESVSVEQETVAVSEAPLTQTEPVDVADATPAAAPEVEMAIDSTAEQTCLDMLSEEPKSEICDMPCQMQLAVESVQLNSAELSAEGALNGHIVPEVSIEG